MARAGEIWAESLDASVLAAQLKGKALALAVFSISHSLAPAASLFIIAANTPGRGNPAQVRTLGMVTLNNEPDNVVFAIARTSIADDMAALAINHALVTESCTFSRIPEESVPHELHTWAINIPMPGGAAIRPASVFSQSTGSTLKGKSTFYLSLNRPSVSTRAT